MKQITAPMPPSVTRILNQVGAGDSTNDYTKIDQPTPPPLPSKPLPSIPITGQPSPKPFPSIPIDSPALSGYGQTITQQIGVSAHKLLTHPVIVPPTSTIMTGKIYNIALSTKPPQLIGKFVKLPTYGDGGISSDFSFHKLGSAITTNTEINIDPHYQPSLAYSHDDDIPHPGGGSTTDSWQLINPHSKTKSIATIGTPYLIATLEKPMRYLTVEQDKQTTLVLTRSKKDASEFVIVPSQNNQQPNQQDPALALFTSLNP